ncbi:hypothetical protein NIGALANA_63 [Bacillus phage Nigalana]|uniref:Uncharacterized protein n=2 Tax=Wphvirus hakuna TaxID=1987729 RepID=A0A222Z2P6_9CAUD|nr:hypothetical protein FP72_gp056 [Bacillus phage Hakuna]YP_009279228.1 hypothetical protein BIZ89_gp061 [Bacillus phage Kida]YP_009282455.1 hypothetical protein BI005_gp063 [Bacillus phage Nigalana]YP_009284388.1 hypothetical protein BI004_gp060 [Bacillus phage NotTheCreek]ASR78300.1 hypothetical protein PPISBEST_62 [Bacillus phage PPIsBest]QDH49335.1 hypothetical protein PHIREBALL_60 [Bacillus phage Phireball]QDH50042.1 hypothetical protein ALPS_56 [Bacillus phage ALPS]AHZ10074.1 hypothet
MTTKFEDDMLSLYMWMDRRARNGHVTKDMVKYMLKEFQTAIKRDFPEEIAKYKEETK